MARDESYYVYILTNHSYTSLYTGATLHLRQRLRQHQSGNGARFTPRYRVNVLVYYELTNDLISARRRERETKLLSRAKKIQLIESLNPGWVDLSEARHPPPPQVLTRIAS